MRYIPVLECFLRTAVPLCTVRREAEHHLLHRACLRAQIEEHHRTNSRNSHAPDKMSLDTLAKVVPLYGEDVPALYERSTRAVGRRPWEHVGA